MPPKKNKELSVYVEKRLETVPTSMKKRYKEAMLGRSRQKRIRMFCLECVGFSAKEVRLCEHESCPLHRFRLKG